MLYSIYEAFSLLICCTILIRSFSRFTCLLDVIHPDSGTSKVLSHVNPWNFTARMMIVHPIQLCKILATPYDVVHVVMPANLSGMFILAAFKILRCIKQESKPALAGECILMIHFASLCISCC